MPFPLPPPASAARAEPLSDDLDPVLALARRHATPVDVVALERQGVVRRCGPWYARWYQVLKPARLPEAARVQITAIRTAPDGVLVRFARRNRPLARLYAELTGTADAG